MNEPEIGTYLEKKERKHGMKKNGTDVDTHTNDLGRGPVSMDLTDAPARVSSCFASPAR